MKNEVSSSVNLKNRDKHTQIYYLYVEVKRNKISNRIKMLFNASFRRFSGLANIILVTKKTFNYIHCFFGLTIAEVSHRNKKEIFQKMKI